MKRRRLWHIIRKTKVIEELVGLLASMMIIAIFLTRLEPGIASYGEAYGIHFSSNNYWFW